MKRKPIKNKRLLPKGYRRLGAVKTDTWFALEYGNTMIGKLLGCYYRVDNRTFGLVSEFFQIKLTAPTNVCSGEKAREAKSKGTKVSTRRASPGTVVNLNCNSKTEKLKALIPDVRLGAEVRIIVFCGPKLQRPGKGAMWDIACAAQTTKPPHYDEVEFD
jgi:hypothetical protein